jgi:tetratricopeptide (TPR) repeat protein
MRLAEIVGQRGDRRDEAIKLLESLPEPSAEDRAGHRGQLYRNSELVALASLNNMRLDKLFSDNSKTSQSALLPQIETDYQKLEAKAPENPLVLRILAKMQIAKGQTTDAIATLSQAINKTDDRNPIHYELMYLAAKCYLATSQTGSAMAYLQQIVQNFPKYDEARILLAQTQLRQNDLKSAKENIAVLAQNRPDSMDVIRMQLAVLQQEKKPEEVKALYAKLPETNRPQALNKANVAMILNLNDDAKRLLEGVLEQNPADVEATLMLSGMYSRAKDNTNALATVDRGLKAVPNDPNLLLERARISGSSPAELKQIRLKEAEKISDPLSRELALMSLTRDDPDQNVPLRHLQAAEKIDPKDPRVLTEMFEYNTARGNFDTASTYADRLADINADKVKGTLFRWRLASARANAEQDAQKRNALLLKTQDLANQLAHDYPDFAQSWICLGQTMQALGRFDEAISSFQSAKDKQPENPDPYRGLIECYYQLKRPEEAGKVIGEAITTLRGSPEFKEMQLQHEMRYGDPEKVVADRAQAVKDNPQDPQSLMMLAQVYANVARNKNAKPGGEKESNVWLEKARDVMAQGAEKFPNELQFTAVYGSLSLMLKQPDQGEKLWTKTLAREQWKDKPEPIAAFADFYTVAKRPADAEKVLRDFLATPAGKDNPDITLKLADLLASQGKIDDALAMVSSIPDNTRLQLRKTELLINKGKLADAESAIKTLMQKQNSPQLTAMLAFVYLNSNRAKEALDLLNQVLADNPSMAQAMWYRALATLRMPNANPNDALSDLVQVRDLAPDNLQARYMLADCLLRLNDVESTIKELEGILRVSPGQKAARVRLMDLYSSQTPPRWLDAERVARDGEAAPELMNDPEFLASEGQLFSRHNDHEHAVRCMTAALKIKPQDPTLIRAYYGVLIGGKMYQQLLTESDKLPKEMKDLWWVHSLRGAAKCKMGDKENGTQEFITAIKTAFDDKNDQEAQTVVDQLVDSTNADSALKVISALPQAAEPRWQLTIAWLQVKKNDVAGARKTIDALLANPDKLSREVHETALAFGGSVYMQLPDPDQNKSRELYLQLLKLRPNDYKIYNNLACNKSVSSADALEYGRKAYELMQEAHTFEPLVADTYGWGLVQSGDDRNLDMGLNVLLEAYGANKNIVDVAYHLGAAYVKKNNATEAEKYLSEAQVLYDEAIKNNQITDATLQPGIIQAQNEVVKLKGKK